MPTVQSLFADHLNVWTTAIQKKSSSGRGTNKKINLYGIKKLRELILELAVRGQLAPQDSSEEPASVLLKKIAIEKAQLVEEGKIKKQKSLPKISEDERPFQLPDGWKWIRLGELCKKVTDGSHNPPKDSGVGFPMLSSQNVNYGKIFFSSPSRYVSEEDFIKENKRTQIEPDDVLLTIVASLGRSAVVPKNAPKFVLQRSVAVLDSLMVSQFLAKHLVSPVCLNYYDTNAKGTAQKGIYLGKLSFMPIAVPAEAEQHRIVSKIDELMALCDQLEQETENSITDHQTLVKNFLATLTESKDAEEFAQNWSRVAGHFDTLFATEDSIDQLKQTILQLAVMGKLVPQDPSDEPASVLLEKIMAEKKQLVKEGKIKKQKPLPPINDNAKPFKLPQGWVWVRPDEFSQKITDGEHFRPPTQAEGIYFLSAKDVRENGVSLEDPLFISAETAEKALQRCDPEYGDLLIVSRGATVGRICKVDVRQVFCLLGSVILIKPTSLVLSDFFSIALKSPNVFQQLISASGSTAQQAIYLRDLKKIVMPLPPLPEQHRIVAKVDELMAVCDQLKASLNDAQIIQTHLADAIVEQAVA
jgi:type I restriction enzyme, S subunit